MTDSVAAVAQAIKSTPDGSVLRIGKVTALEAGAGSRARTDISGETWLGLDTDARIAVGDRVYVHQQGPVMVVAGKLNGTPRPESAYVPVGGMSMWAGTAAAVPAGWLLCDGRSLVRADFPVLFAAIGTTYGAPSSTTFALPDLENRVPLGAGARAPGTTGGAETHTLTSAQMPVHGHTATSPAHTHTVNHDHTTDPHSHSLATGAANIAAPDTAGQLVADNVSGSTGSTTVNVDPFNGSSGSADPGITVENTGNGQQHNIMQPYLAVLVILRAT